MFCNVIRHRAKKRWGTRADTRRDDITAIVIGFKWVSRADDQHLDFEKSRAAPLPARDHSPSEASHTEPRVGTAPGSSRAPPPPQQKTTVSS